MGPLYHAAPPPHRRHRNRGPCCEFCFRRGPSTPGSMLSVSLPDSYEPLIMALQSRSEILTFDYIAGRLLQVSIRRQAATATHGNPGHGSGQSAFIAGGPGKGKGRGGGFRGGSHQRGRGRSHNPFGTTDISRIGNASTAGRGQTKKKCLDDDTIVTGRDTGRPNALKEKQIRLGVASREMIQMKETKQRLKQPRNEQRPTTGLLNPGRHSTYLRKGTDFNNISL